MCLISVAMIETTCPASKDVDDLLVSENTGDGCITAAETFANGQNVWNYVFLLEGEECPCSTDAAHDLVKDE